MSYQIYFSLSVCELKSPLAVPTGTLAGWAEHVERVEQALAIGRDPDRNAWLSDAFDPLSVTALPEWIPRVELCREISAHNEWVRTAYEDMGAWLIAPVGGGEMLTTEKLATVWRGFRQLDIPLARWSIEHYQGRRLHLSRVMGGQEDEGVTLRYDTDPIPVELHGAVLDVFGPLLDPHLPERAPLFDGWGTPWEGEGLWGGYSARYRRDADDRFEELLGLGLTPEQAAAMTILVSPYVEVGDLRLDCPRGRSSLASSYDGEYTWCRWCRAVHEDDSCVHLVIEGSRDRFCPTCHDWQDDDKVCVHMHELAAASAPDGMVWNQATVEYDWIEAAVI